MSNTFFKFKQFIVNQDRCGMKVSTDAVVLGALAGKKSPLSILDVGVGTGVISLMLAQRFDNATVFGVEIEDSAFGQALENIQASKFAKRVSVKHQDFQTYSDKSDQQFDMIVSNPPYFPDHIKTNDAQRNKALHNDSLSFEDLVAGVIKCLDESGEFWVILPPRQMQDLEEICKIHQLLPFHKVNLKDKQETKVIRVIQGFSYGSEFTLENELFIKNPDGSFAKAYQKLLKDFLLIF
ncbi:putative O-methyltransferase [Belliella baltica DSM 15883]|uniref:tRNA1(Val) (adenine(37)-N6)-methyltransferase n=1 Tax=Belliella baltica (strain DSM 15883 / CIP 108006 / LMG 21964 / BA134) TaxID=866536 RepID=I3Z4H8_BELBD|nr:methyltransferase [Belliella baltica]AFL84146.1 putative O-methyltransferase [Belliella baltica DSM 15883]